jgi:hypothetical protein
MSQISKTIIRWTAAAAAISLLLLAEDWVFWFVPAILDSISHPLLQIECSEVKAGQSREQVLKIMHRWTTPTGEAGDKPEQAFGFTIELGHGQGYDSCTVEVDPSTGIVKAARYQHEQYGEFGPVIE